MSVALTGVRAREMSATVSQAPPALYLYDVEAALPTASSPPAAPAAAPAAAPPPAVVVEIEVEPDAGAGAGTGAAGAARETPLNGTTGYASVVVVGFVGMVRDFHLLLQYNI